MTSFVFLSALLLGQSCAQVSTEISSQNLSCPLYSSQFFEPNSKNLNITGRAALENLTAIDQNGYVNQSVGAYQYMYIESRGLEPDVFPSILQYDLLLGVNGSSGLSLPSNKSALGVCQVVIDKFGSTGSSTNSTSSCSSTISDDCLQGVMSTISQGIANATFDTDAELQNICSNVSYAFSQGTLQNSFNLFQGCGISEASVSAPATLPSNQTCTIENTLDSSVSPNSTWQYYGGFTSSSLVVALVYVPRKNSSVVASGNMIQMVCAPGNVTVEKLGPLSEAGSSTTSASTSTGLGSNLHVPGASPWTFGAGLLGLLYAL